MKKKHVRTDCYQWELTAEINLPLKKETVASRSLYAVDMLLPAERLREMNHNKASISHGTSVGTDGGLTYHHMNQRARFKAQVFAWKWPSKKSR